MSVQEMLDTDFYLESKTQEFYIATMPKHMIDIDKD
jgi:hypothetical protein